METVIGIEARSPSEPNDSIILEANIMPKMEWTMPISNGAIKKIAIWTKSALFNILLLAPRRRKAAYFSILSEDSESCLRARIAAEEIKKIVPR